MKKPVFVKMKWHALVISIFILGLSIGSWVNSFDSMKSLVVNYLSKQSEITHAEITEFEKAESGKAESEKTGTEQIQLKSEQAKAEVAASETASKSASRAASAAEAAGSAVSIPAGDSSTPADLTSGDSASGKKKGKNLAFQIARRLKKKTTSLCQMIDSITDKIQLNWSVYKEKELSHMDTLATYYWTGEVASVQVLSGKGKWLFYQTKTDGDPIADFEGTNLYTQEKMEKMASAVLHVQNKLESRGTKLVILVVPNKENIYWEQMPDTFVHAEESSTDLLIDYLQEKGVHIVSPKKELLASRSSPQMYYYYDSHWNQLGAYIGVRETLAFWNISIPALSERTFTSKNLYGNFHYNAQDDLAKLAGLRSVFTDDIEYEIDGTASMDWKKYGAEQSAKTVSHFINEQAPVQASILLVGDSFRSSMLPSLREQFSDVYVILRTDYSPDMLDDVNPDYLIAEYAERYSKSISGLNLLLHK